MDVKKELRIIAFVFMLFIGCIAEDQQESSGYIFTAPKSIQTDSVNQLQLIRYCEPGEDDFLVVRIYYSPSYNGNETLSQEQEYKLEGGKSDTLLELFVNAIEGENVYNGRLEINGTVCGECIGGSDKIYFSNNPTKWIYITETDKPIYKPGQTVYFRVLKLDKNLKPSSDEDDIGEVYVEDPKGTRLAQFKGVHMGKGITQMDFPLSDEPNLGIWRITVWNNNVTETQTFEVKKYELPKFDVTIEYPSFVLANVESILVKICAKYTYGKPVKGMLSLNASLERYSYSRDKTPVLHETHKIDGCYNYTLNVSKIDPGNNRYRRIVVEVKVTENGTDVERTKTEYLQRQYSPLNMNFQTEHNYKQYYKPGLPYIGKLRVTNPDDTPAPDEPIEICFTVDRKRVMMKVWLAENKMKYCSNYTSDEDGYISYIIPPQSTDAESIQLEAKSLKYARDSQNSGSRLDSLNQPSTSISLSPFFSPSGSFIQMENIGSPIPCGTEKKIKFLFTSKDNSEFKLRYEIVRRGNVVQTGIEHVSFDAKDDVSPRFDDSDELINDSEVQLVPAPELTSSDSDDSSDGDENCQSAKDSKYKPYIGEAHISLDVDRSWSPSFTLLVFYVRDDRETVADSQKIAVEKCFKNEVEFEFGDEVQQPGTKTSIKIKSSPNSLCGIKVVDKSVSLLNSNDQLTKEKVFQYLDRFDTGYYYSSNPCNDPMPQPGLYSAKESSIIRPPYNPWSSSQYQDSLAAFQDTGFLTISNLILFTRPCFSGGGYQSQSFSVNSGHAVALASSARRPARPQAASAGSGFAADKMGEISATKSAVDVRDFFPETWLFEMDATGSDGEYITKEKLPHTITEWEGSAVCINDEDGLGLSDTATIKGFQAFFISYTLPYSVIRGEVFTIVVSVYNYKDEAIPITLSLDKSDKFVLIGDSVDNEQCIQPQDSTSMKVPIKASKLGTVNFTARAETTNSDGVCEGSNIYDGLAKDAITQPIEVEPEGFPNEKVQSFLFCPTDEEDQTFRGSLDLALPDDLVPDSDRAIVDVTGDVMGKAIENLNNLITLPTGCGEQNMVKFTPNYLAINYLAGIGKLVQKTKEKAISNLQKGYQRQLTYRHTDGSFSAFGENGNPGSMFLTCFVLKSFYEAQKYITIDQNILTTAQNWIASKQLADGCLPNVGQIIDRGIQGGLEKEKNNEAITAYCASALINSKYENETVVNNAMQCIGGDDSRRPYDTVLIAYAEALAGKTEAARKRLDTIRPMANNTEGMEFYKTPNGSKSLEVETASYAVLAELLLSKLQNGEADPKVVLGFIRYLAQNLNARGGFYSTQDTCVGLEAMAEFAELVYKDPVDIHCVLSGIFDKDFEINQDNKLLVQRSLVTNVPGEIKIEATGSGCALIQVALRYNTINPPKKQYFYLEVVATCKSTDCKQIEIRCISSYIPSGKASGMSVVQVNMMTGIVADRENLDKLKNDKKNQILRVEYEGKTATFYFDSIDNKGVDFTFLCNNVVNVENPQPASAVVYDYYAPEYSAKTMYTYRNSESSKPSPDSGSSEP